jgi:hypothetical protein
MLILSSEIFNDYNSLDRERKPRADIAQKRKETEVSFKKAHKEMSLFMGGTIHSIHPCVNYFVSLDPLRVELFGI